ncbi:MAG: CheR family methyltransferase [Pseudomonadota bacterium]
MQVQADETFVPGISPQVYGKKDFQRICDMLRAEAGIVLNDKKRMLAYSRIAPLVRESGLQTFEDYLDLLATDRAEHAKTIASLTTNHTYFNREAHHFDHFNAEVRGDLIARANARDPVRIWSAGCSSGEEIYTLMMVLLGMDKRHGQAIARKGGIVVLASDLAEHAVNAAQRALYPEEALSKVPEKLRENWCEKTEEDGAPMLAISSHITNMLRYRQLNLLRPWPFSAQFDVIFCRNVMIYFDGPTKDALLVNFARQLKPGGYLYIGHSERVSGEASGLLEPVGSTIYRRNAA